MHFTFNLFMMYIKLQDSKVLEKIGWLEINWKPSNETYTHFWVLTYLVVATWPVNTFFLSFLNYLPRQLANFFFYLVFLILLIIIFLLLVTQYSNNIRSTTLIHSYFDILILPILPKIFRFLLSKINTFLLQELFSFIISIIIIFYFRIR